MGIDAATLDRIMADIHNGLIPVQPPIPLSPEALEQALEAALYYADDRWKQPHG